MFGTVCRGYTEFKPCPYLLKECSITTPFRIDLDGEEAYCIAPLYTMEDWFKQKCIRDRKDREKASRDEITEIYNVLKSKKNLNFSLEEVLEKYKEHGMLKE